MLHIHSRMVWLVGVVVWLCVGTSSVAAQSKSLQWTRLDCDVVVQPNGDLRVSETNVIDFTSGTFTFGYRDIDQSRLTGIDAIAVTEEGQPLRFETSQTDTGDFRIKYYFSSPAQREQRTLVMAYTVHGAVRYYNNGDVVYWTGVYAARNGYAVQDSRVAIHLPQGAAATSVAAFGPKASVTGKGEGVVVAVAQEPIISGKQFEVLAAFPHGIITGAAAPWQSHYDYEQQAKVQQQQSDAVLLLVALLILVGGPALVVVLWYMRGRDPDVGLVADYLTEPPAGMTPGVAGALIDEKADLQDVVATLVDLARRRVLTLKEHGQGNAAGVVYNRDFLLARGPSYDGAKLAGHERKLLDALGLKGGGERAMSELSRTLSAKVEGIKSALYDEMIRQGLYSRSPESVRTRYQVAGVLVIVAACGFGCLFASVLSEALSEMALCIAGSAGITGIALLAGAKAMPVRTRTGADARMRLTAFKRYLSQIEKYTDLKTATDQFDRYLPYAIAFGLDRTWVHKFTAVNAPAPAWFIPDISTSSHSHTTHSGMAQSIGAAVLSGKPGDISGAAVAPVTLESVNQGLTAGLTDVNKGLTTMFTSVSTAFLSQPSRDGSHSNSTSGLEIAGAVIGAVIDIAAGGGGSSGSGGGGFG